MVICENCQKEHDGTYKSGKYEKLYYRLNEKWQHYIENSEIKKKALEKYCQENSYMNFWFTNKTDKTYKYAKLDYKFY